MSIITSNSFPKELQPGLKAKFDGMYEKLSPVWKKIYQIDDSKKKYEEIISMYKFGLPTKKSEGSNMGYDNMSQGLTIRHTHNVWALAAEISQEAVEDNQYDDVSNRAVVALNDSHATNEEYEHARIFNNGFTVANEHQQGGDGQYLFDTDHVSRNGTFSNLLTSAPLSRTSLQDARIQVMLTKDETGIHPAGLMMKQLIVPVHLQDEAQEILGSPLQPDNANNGINTMNGVTPYVVWQFLDSTYGGSDTAWYVQTTAREGLMHYQRYAPKIWFSTSDDAMTQKIHSASRYINGVNDVRCAFGNLGV